MKKIILSLLFVSALVAAGCAQTAEKKNNAIKVETKNNTSSFAAKANTSDSAASAPEKTIIRPNHKYHHHKKYKIK